MLEQYTSWSEKDVTFKLPKDMLIYAVLNSAYADQCSYDERTGNYNDDWIKITDKHLFVEDLIATLVAEAEDGSSILSHAIDNAFQNLVEYGFSDGMEFKNENYSLAC